MRYPPFVLVENKAQCTSSSVHYHLSSLASYQCARIHRQSSNMVHAIVREVTGGPILRLTVPSCLGGSSEEQNSAANWRTTLVELMDGRMNTTALWIEV